MSKIKSIIFFLAFGIAGIPSPVLALPFKEDPNSFQQYLNALRWTDGSKAYFQNIGSCIGGRPDAEGRYFLGVAYTCMSGFVTITSPMGKKVCSVDSVGYWVTGNVRYSIQGCRWK